MPKVESQVFSGQGPWLNHLISQPLTLALHKRSTPLVFVKFTHGLVSWSLWWDYVPTFSLCLVPFYFPTCWFIYLLPTLLEHQVCVVVLLETTRGLKQVWNGAVIDLNTIWPHPTAFITFGHIPPPSQNKVFLLAVWPVCNGNPISAFLIPKASVFNRHLPKMTMVCVYSSSAKSYLSNQKTSQLRTTMRS